MLELADDSTSSTTDRRAVHKDPNAGIITSMIGSGNLLGRAEVLAAPGSTLSRFTSADHLAATPAWPPTLCDSDRGTGNLHRLCPFNRQLQRSLLHPQRRSASSSPASTAFTTASALRTRTTAKPYSRSPAGRVNVLSTKLRESKTLRPNKIQAEPPPLDKEVDNRGITDIRDGGRAMA